MAEKTHEEKLFGAACLKLKLADAGGTSELYRKLLDDLGVTEEEVEAYLAEHRDVVKAALDAHGQPRH